MNKAKSVLARLHNISKNKQEDYNYLLTRYGIERLLYRLVQTSHADRFVLKGALLFVLWDEDTHRPTKDIDLLGMGPIDEQKLLEIFRDICKAEVPDDGVHFNPDSIVVEEIRQGEFYHGYRVKIRASLGTAEIRVQVDIGLGDTIYPEPVVKEFPPLLDEPGPDVKIYPRGTMVAEKFDTIIELGMRNSRMKDYFDLYILAKNFDFEGEVLAHAIVTTLLRRGRTLPFDNPIGLTEEFYNNLEKKKQWHAFLSRAAPNCMNVSLQEVITLLQIFFEKIIQVCLKGNKFEANWIAGGPWNVRE